MHDRALTRRDHLICYAVKANSSLAVINLLARLGSGFDIVSGGELERALPLYRSAAGMAGLHVVGIGCHIGSQLTEIPPFVAAQ